MKYKNLIIFFILFILLTSFSLAKASFASAYTLTGKVLDANGVGVPDQCVNLGTAIGAVTTDSTGTYSIQADPGSYNVLVANCTVNYTNGNIPQNYNIRTLDTLTLDQDKTLNLSLPIKQVTVHVQNTNGDAIQGVIISLNATKNTNLTLAGLAALGTSSYGSSTSTETDSYGNMNLWLFPTDPSDPNNTYTVFATPLPGAVYGSSHVNNVTFQSNTTINVTLPDAYLLSGYVLDSLGNATPNQCIHFGGSDINSATSNTQGFYSIQEVPGNYQIQAKSCGGNSSSDNGNLPGSYVITTGSTYQLNSNSTLNLTIPVNQLIVHVQDPNGSAISGVIIANNDNSVSGLTLGGISASGNSSSSRRTDDYGNATLWLFPTSSSNPYTITATPTS